MSLFNFDQEQILTFFAVLVRFSVLFSILPFLGDRFVPTPIKVLLSLAVTIALFPALVSTGAVRPGDSLVWARTTSGIAGTIACEVLFALVLGFTAKMAFESISFGGNLVGNFMGFAAASTYDPHQESQTQVVAQLQMALAMLIFLAIDGHHLLLQASLDSYRIVGLGGFAAALKPEVSGPLSQKLIEVTGQVIRYGVILAAPVAVSMFAVNVAFGIMAKAMPQLNILVLSFAVTALVGLLVMLLGLSEFQGMVGEIYARGYAWLEQLMVILRG